MRIARLVFGALAAVSLVFSAVVHFSTFVGVDPDDLFPPVWFLHLGAMVVFIAAMCADKSAKTDPLLGRAPRWMACVLKVLLAYGFVNGAIVVFLNHQLDSEGTPSKRDDGTYVVRFHGEVVRSINAEEFHRYQGYIARFFSGGWMAFYTWSLTMLVSSSRTPAGHDQRQAGLGCSAETSGR
jgi:hypothetical protein